MAMTIRLSLAAAAFLTLSSAAPAFAAPGSHVQEISRKNRGKVIFVVDRSDSMSGQFGAHANLTKAQALHTLTNDALQNFMRMSNDGDNVRDYMDVSVVSIGGQNEAKVLVPSTPIAQLHKAVKRVATGASGKKMGIWIDHHEPEAAKGSTPITAGLNLAHDIAKDWIAKNPNAFPPTIIFVTDGHATQIHRGQYYDEKDEMVTAAADQLKGLKTADGNALLLMAHISGEAGAQKVEFASSDAGLDAKQKLLFNISSHLPDTMLRLGNLQKGAKGFVSQGDLNSLIKMYNIGTQSVIPTGLTLSTKQSD
jgi:Mg-chelatase subunit ChlD